MRVERSPGKVYSTPMALRTTPISDPLKGVLLLVAGTACLSTVPVLAKVVLTTMPSTHFSALWMLASTVWGSLWLFRGGFTGPWLRFRAGWRAVLLTGLLAAGWVYFYFKGLELLNPAVATFVINSRIVWAVIIGMIFLQERYNVVQLLGIAAVAGGVVLIFSGATEHAETLGVIYVLIAALFFVLGNLVVKRALPGTGVDIVLLARFLFPAALLLPLSFAAGSPWPYLSTQNVLLIAGGSLFGPFLSFLLIYSALRYLHLGIHTVFQSVSIVFSAALTYLVFGTLPSTSKLIGGVLVIIALVVVGLFSSGDRETPEAAVVEDGGV